MWCSEDHQVFKVLHWGEKIQALSPFHCPRISYEQTFELKEPAATSSSSVTDRHDFNQIDVSRFLSVSLFILSSFTQRFFAFPSSLFIYIYILLVLVFDDGRTHINLQPAETNISINFPWWRTPHPSSAFHSENKLMRSMRRGDGQNLSSYDNNCPPPLPPSRSLSAHHLYNHKNDVKKYYLPTFKHKNFYH